MLREYNAFLYLTPYVSCGKAFLFFLHHAGETPVLPGTHSDP